MHLGEKPSCQKCILGSIPNAFRSDVKSCAVFSVGSAMVEDFT